MTQTAMMSAFKNAKASAGVNCPYCGKPANLVDGTVIYPHRPDLSRLKFWHCAPCDAYVGCHKPNRRLGFDGTHPLGRLANKELRRAKNNAHCAFDPLWQDGTMSRSDAYAWLASQLGISMDSCHIGEFDVEMCSQTVVVCRSMANPHRPPRRFINTRALMEQTPSTAE